jgi:transcription-repair coupling factor (superfamily II helicase)
MYKRIAFTETEEDERDVIDELTDRFGTPPPDALNLIRVARIRAVAKRLGVLRVREAQRKYIFEMKSGVSFEAAALDRMLKRYGKEVLIHGGAKPFFALRGHGEAGGKLKEIMDFLSCLVV